MKKIRTPEKKVRVLIVDDQKLNVELWVELLNRAKFEASGAIGGAAGLRLALELNPDVVLSDVAMPDVTGLELLDKLKQAKLETRFIFITGERKDLRDTVELMKHGACDVLHKPCSTAELVSCINRAYALETRLSMYGSEPTLVVKQAIAEVDDYRRTLFALHKEINDLKATLRWQRILEAVIIRLLYLAAAVGVTGIFYRYGLIERGVMLFALPGLLFVLLSLPFDRIKTFFARIAKGESRAIFK